jgi:hypothetical protein
LQYFTFLIFLAFAVLVLGGFCFILTNTAISYLKQNWDTIVASIPPSQRATFTQDATVKIMTIALYSVGGFSLVVFFICLAAMSNAVALITPSRAYTVFLQATNIAMLPIGVALIAAAAYVADTAVAAEAAAAAFAIFILGTFVIVLLLVGCIGTSLQSRGIVRLFMFMTTLLSSAFLAFGVLSLVQSNLVSGFITSQWNVVRRVLPPDFSGRYDREIFQRFVDANLTALGFLSVCAGVVLLAQTFASFRLRSELKFENELEQEAWDAVKNKLLPAEVAQTLSNSNHKSRAHVMWKQHWTKGTKCSRRIIMCGCGSMCALVVIAVGLASAALYYSTSCTTLSGYKVTQDYDTQDFGPFTYVYNNYSLGTIGIKVDAARSTPTTTISYMKAAWKQDMAIDTWPDAADLTFQVTSTSVDPMGTGVDSQVTMHGLETVQKAKTLIIGYDIACQNSELNVIVPTAGVYTSGLGNTREAGDTYPMAMQLRSEEGSAGIEIDFTPVAYADRPRIRALDLATTVGTISVQAALLGSTGVFATSTLGEITIEDVEARCASSELGSGHAGVNITSDKGSINLMGLNSLDCDVALSVNEALSQVVRANIRNTLGGATLSMVGARGVMQVLHSEVDVVDMKGDEGTIRSTNCTIREALKIASRAGGVTVETLHLAPRGVLQIETDSGDVNVWAARFRGIISVVTSGNIQCLGGTATGFDDASPCTVTSGGTLDGTTGTKTLKVVEQVSINCKTSTKNDCPYLGHITITSTTGNVVLRMDKVSW